MLIPQNSAFNRPFYVGVTSLTLSVQLSKNGGAFGAAGGSVSEISLGWYQLALNSTDTNTVGALAWSITGSGLPTILGLPVDQVGAAIGISGVVVE